MDDQAGFCTNCGALLAPGAQFCNSCGTSVSSSPDQGQPGAGAESPTPPSTPTVGPGAATGTGMPAGPPYGPPPGAPPPPGTAAVPEDGASRRKWIIGGVIALVVLLIGGAAAFFLLTRDDDDSAAGEDEILLEPAGMRITNAFTDSVGQLVGKASPLRPEVPTVGGAAGGALGHLAKGDTPGLYGGTQREGTCDADQLVEFLEENPDKAAAWAEVVGTEPDEIREYVETLTPVLLRRDTLVTNHGFSNGEATPLLSVLQAGTAVMVDRQGIPRVKCNCGNPLSPAPEITDPQFNRDDEWEGFDEDQVVVIDTDVEIDIDVFVLVDNETGEFFNRPFGTNGEEDEPLSDEEVCELFPDEDVCDAEPPTTDEEPPTTDEEPPTTDEEPPTTEPDLGTGDVQVTLRWESTADVDLEVTAPNGETISYLSPSASSGGELDVDANSNCDPPLTSNPVENIFWPTGSAPTGTYTIDVSYYQDCEGNGPQSFTVTVKVDGQTETFDGTLTGEGGTETFTFDR